MKLHRIIQLAGFVPDPDWSGTQVEPPASVIATELGGTAIGTQSQGGRIYWTVIPYDGNTVDSKPTSDPGATFDGRLVYTTNAEHDGASTSKLVIGRKSPGEVEGAAIPVGREIEELNVPRGVSCTLQMISLAPGGAPATHLWLFWSYERRTSGS